MNKDIKVPRAQDFCQQKNIPFSSEEHNFYRMNQQKMRFKHYATSVNKCFETARPSELSTGKKLMVTKAKEGQDLPPVEKVTKEFLDKRLYVSNAFQEAHQRFMSENTRKTNGKKKLVAKRSSTNKEKQKKHKAPDTYGKLF